MNECSKGKKKFDKKSAISLKNLTMKLHHIKMTIYECEICKSWHLSNNDEKHRGFRHTIKKFSHKRSTYK